MTDTQTAPVSEIVAPMLGGYAPRGRYRRVECDYLEPIEGGEKLWAEIRADLPFAALDDIPISADDTYLDLWSAIAPHVRAWNALGLDIKTGTYQPVPPPCELGPDAFRHVDPHVGIWIGNQLKQTYREAVSGPKSSGGQPPSAPTPKPSNATASASSAPAKPSRKSRKDSPATSPST